MGRLQLDDGRIIDQPPDWASMSLDRRDAWIESQNKPAPVPREMTGPDLAAAQAPVPTATNANDSIWHDVMTRAAAQPAAAPAPLPTTAPSPPMNYGRNPDSAWIMPDQAGRIGAVTPLPTAPRTAPIAGATPAAATPAATAPAAATPAATPAETLTAPAPGKVTKEPLAPVSPNGRIQLDDGRTMEKPANWNDLSEEEKSDYIERAIRETDIKAVPRDMNAPELAAAEAGGAPRLGEDLTKSMWVNPALAREEIPAMSFFDPRNPGITMPDVMDTKGSEPKLLAGNERQRGQLIETVRRLEGEIKQLERTNPGSNALRDKHLALDDASERLGNLNSQQPIEDLVVGEDTSSLKQDLQAGGYSLLAGGRATLISSQLKQLVNVQKDIVELKGILAKPMPNELLRGQMQMQLDQALKRRDSLGQSYAETLKNLTQNLIDANGMPTNPAAAAFLNPNAKTSDLPRLMFSSPGNAYAIIRTIAARSAAASLPSLVGGVGGAALGGPAGAAIGAGLGSASTEYGNEIINQLMNFKANLGDPESVKKVMAEHQDEIMLAVARRALIVGGADALTGWLSGAVGEKMLSVGKAAAIRKALTGSAIEMAGGAGGEAAAETFEPGGLQPGQILAEALGEAPGGVISLTTGVREGGKAGVQVAPEAKPAVEPAQTVPAQTAPPAIIQPATPAVPPVEPAKREPATAAPPLAPSTGGAPAQTGAPSGPVKLGDPTHEPLIRQAATDAGLDPDYMVKVAAIESSGRADATRGDHVGLFQFGPAAWADYGAGGDPNNPQDQAAAMVRMTRANFDGLSQALGHAPTPAELYMAHQQGLAGATKLLQADPNANAASVLGADAVTGNGGNVQQTIAEYRQFWQQKYDAAGGGGAAPATTAQPAAQPAQPGKFNYGTPQTMGDPDSPNYQQENIVPVEVNGQTWQVHKQAQPHFQSFLEELHSHGVPISSSGGYNNRDIRGRPGVKSQHAYGNAIDINAAEMPLGKATTFFQKYGLSDDQVREMAARHGLVWGGDFKGRPDPMHFEWGGGGGTTATTPLSTTETTTTLEAEAPPSPGVASATSAPGAPAAETGVASATSPETGAQALATQAPEALPTTAAEIQAQEQTHIDSAEEHLTRAQEQGATVDDYLNQQSEAGTPVPERTEGWMRATTREDGTRASTNDVETFKRFLAQEVAKQRTGAATGGVASVEQGRAGQAIGGRVEQGGARPDAGRYEAGGGAGRPSDGQQVAPAVGGRPGQAAEGAGAGQPGQTKAAGVSKGVERKTVKGDGRIITVTDKDGNVTVDREGHVYPATQAGEKPMRKRLDELRKQNPDSKVKARGASQAAIAAHNAQVEAPAAKPVAALAAPAAPAKPTEAAAPAPAAETTAPSPAAAEAEPAKPAKAAETEAAPAEEEEGPADIQSRRATSAGAAAVNEGEAGGWARKKRELLRKSLGEQIAEFVADFKSSFQRNKPTGETLKGDASAWNRIKSLGQAVAYSAGGRLVAYANMYDSPALQRLADMFQTTAGNFKETYSGGSARRSQSFDLAVKANMTQDSNEVINILRPLGMTGERFERDMVDLGDAMRTDKEPTEPRLQRAFRDLKNFYARKLLEMKEAGVIMGDRGESYYRRIFNRAAIQQDTDRFIDIATKEYERADEAAATKDYNKARDAADKEYAKTGDGKALSKALETARKERDKAIQEGKDTSRARAKGLSSAIVFGDMATMQDFGNFGGMPGGSIVQGRQFGASADEAFKDFYFNDPAEVALAYSRESNLKMETVRRLGSKGETWTELMNQARKEGVPEEVRTDFARLISTIMGQNSDRFMPNKNANNALDLLRTYSTLGMLDKAVFASLTESIMPAIRRGGIAAPIHLASALTRTVREFAADVFLNDPASVSEAREFAETAGLLLDSQNVNLSAMRLTHDVPTGNLSQKLKARFFRSNLLTQLTNAQKIAGVQQARAFLRDQAKALLKGGAQARDFLTEVRVPKDKQKEFADFIMSFENGMPTRFDLDGEMGKYYENALHVFLSQAIMDPTAADKPRWMSTASGSLIGQFAGFSWATGRNVLARYGRLGFRALDPRSDWSVKDRANALATPLYGVVGAYLMGSLIRMLRDLVFPDEAENRKRLTAKQKQLQIIAQSGLMGPFEGVITPFVAWSPTRQAGAISVPIQNLIMNPLNRTFDYFNNDTDSTTTHERKAARSYLDTLNGAWVGGAQLFTPRWMRTAVSIAPEVLKSSILDWTVGPESKKATAAHERNRKKAEKEESPLWKEIDPLSAIQTPR